LEALFRIKREPASISPIANFQREDSMITRRDLFRNCALGGICAISGSYSRRLVAQTNGISPILPSPEIDQFKKAQQVLLNKYGVKTESKYLKLDRPPLTAHVLEAGRGDPVLLLHGGNATAAQFAPLMGPLQHHFHLFAPDRPGCGLTDKIDYRGVPFRQHALDFVTAVLDGLKLQKVAIVASSMGGYFALVFALAHPERVTRLVLLGEPAASGPPQPNAPAPPPAPRNPSIQGIRSLYKVRLGVNVELVANEVFEEELAAARLPGAGLAWDTMREEFQRQQLSTYALRPELSRLKPSTLFIWGDKDSLGTGPAMGQQMATIAPQARCEVLQNAGHLAWLEKPEECARLTIEFLKSTA
jgi:pimeloyl-ACP methyl ester carboxylesterase